MGPATNEMDYIRQEKDMGVDLFICSLTARSDSEEKLQVEKCLSSDSLTPPVSVRLSLSLSPSRKTARYDLFLSPVILQGKAVFEAGNDSTGDCLSWGLRRRFICHSASSRTRDFI